MQLCLGFGFLFFFPHNSKMHRNIFTAFVSKLVHTELNYMENQDFFYLLSVLVESSQLHLCI